MEEGLERTLSEDVGLCGRCGELDFPGSSGTWTARSRRGVSSRLPLVGHSLSPFPPSHRRAMDVRLPAMNLIISSSCPGNPEGFFRGEIKTTPLFPGLEDPSQAAFAGKSSHPSSAQPKAHQIPLSLGMSDKMAGLLLPVQSSTNRFSFCIIGSMQHRLLDPGARRPVPQIMTSSAHPGSLYQRRPRLACSHPRGHSARGTVHAIQEPLISS